MARIPRTAAAQPGPIARDEPRASAVARMIALPNAAHAQGCDRVAFPERALTTFLPRWIFPDPAKVDARFETAMPNPATRPLFDRARDLGIAVSLGHADLTEASPFNTSILADKAGRIVNCDRRVHLPGHADPLTAIMPVDATAEEQAAIRAVYGLDRPLPVQYAIWIGTLLQGDTGKSGATGRPVAGDVFGAVQNPLLLAASAVVIAFTIGVLLDVLAGLTQAVIPAESVDGAPYGAALMGPAGSDIPLIALARKKKAQT